MEKKKVKEEKKTVLVTQCQYLTEGAWMDRFEYNDLPSAQEDIKFAKAFATKNNLKYRYRLIKRETLLAETLEEE